MPNGPSHRALLRLYPYNAPRATSGGATRTRLRERIIAQVMSTGTFDDIRRLEEPRVRQVPSVPVVSGRLEVPTGECDEIVVMPRAQK